MKNSRYLLRTALFLLLAVHSSSACDFCNCIAGINPFYSRQNHAAVHFLFQHSYATPAASSSPAAIVGRMPARSLHTIPSSGNAVDEKRRTAELSLQFSLSDRWSLTGLLPIVSRTVTTTAARTINGNGDVTLIGNYALLDPELDDGSWVVRTGVGIKLPTGDHTSKESNGTLLDIREQLGTGSVDGLLTAQTSTMLGDIATGGDITLQWNGNGPSGSRIGASLSSSLFASRDLYRNNPALFAVVGFIGLRFEHAGKDRINNAVDPASGTQSLYGTVGFQSLFDNFRLSLTALAPLRQVRPAGGAEERTRTLVGIQYGF